MFWHAALVEVDEEEYQGHKGAWLEKEGVFLVILDILLWYYTKTQPQEYLKI